MSNPTSGKVVLRRFLASDISVVKQLISASDAGRSTTPYWRPMSDIQLAAHLGLPDKEESLVLAITRPGKESEVLGLTNLGKIDLRQGVAEPGVTLWLPSTRGERLGRSALWLVCNMAFQSYPLERLAARIMVDNAPALANSEAIGFRREGRQRSALFLNGARHDLILLGMLRGGLMPPAQPLPWERP